MNLLILYDGSCKVLLDGDVTLDLLLNNTAVKRGNRLGLWSSSLLTLKLFTKAIRSNGEDSTLNSGVDVVMTSR